MTFPITPLMRVEDITSEHLTNLLRHHDPAVTVTGLEVTRFAQGSTTHVHLVVAYADPATTLPTQLFLKTQMQTVEGLPAETAAGLAEGGGASAMLRAEARFYSEVRPQLSIETPATYFSAVVPGCQFIILCEDLAARDARIVRPDVPLSLEQMRGLLQLLARLHAEFWESPRLQPGGDLDWIDHPLTGEFSAFMLGEHNEASLIQQLEQPYKAEIFAKLDVDREGLRRMFAKLQEEMVAGPITLAHGDAHVGNAYFLPDGSVGMLDWQVIRRSSWAHDVGYAIINALDPETRRRNERELLEYYRGELTAAGLATPPDAEEMWQLYCLTPVWGLRLYGVTPTEMYSEAIIGTQLRKFLAAYHDLETSKRLR